MKRAHSNPDHYGLPAVFTYSSARTAGMSSDRLHSYRLNGVVEQIARGLYRWSDTREADLNLLEIVHRAPQGTLCLISALAHHGLTDVIPPRIDIAIPRGHRIPVLQSPVTVHAFAAKTFNLGRETLKIGDQAQIGLYSAERSLIDNIRLRHREGPDIAWEALRRWLRGKGSKPAKLMEMAKHFHGAETALRGALDVVL